MSLFTDIAYKLIKELKEKGIEAYVWHTATTGSVYIRFSDNRMCSIRIGNHDGRERLKYKFNLRSDMKKDHKKWVKDDKVWRCYIRLDQWRELIPILEDRHKQIQSWPDAKYQYNIPSFKQKAS